MGQQEFIQSYILWKLEYIFRIAEVDTGQMPMGVHDGTAEEFFQS
jgi:hypothetical protein